MHPRPYQYYIDLVGGCNLKCPSCPVGNSRSTPRPSGVMSDEMFDAILSKIRREHPEIEHVRLFNWTEPLLHPRLPELIRIAWGHGIGCIISTNLNHGKDLEAVVRAEPLKIRISLSGFTQEKYGRTHERGHIDTVLANMHRVREAIDRYKVRTSVEVPYHCYVDNLDADYRSMRALCRKLDFRFEPCWAYLMPVEKNLEYLERGLTGKDQDLLKLLAVKPEEAREVSFRHMEDDCVLRSGQTVINCDGSVALCCGVYDSRFTIAGSFLEVEAAQLRKLKYSHPFCGTCMNQGLHVSVTYGGVEEWNTIAARRIHPQKVPRELLPKKRGPVRRLKKRLRQLVSSWIPRLARQAAPPQPRKPLT